MKSRPEDGQYSWNTHLAIGCPILLACLTGRAPEVSLAQFFQVWKTIVPESNIPFPEPDGQGQATATRRFKPARTGTAGAAAGNIREGPD